MWILKRKVGPEGPRTFECFQIVKCPVRSQGEARRYHVHCSSVQSRTPATSAVEYSCYRQFPDRSTAGGRGWRTVAAQSHDHQVPSTEYQVQGGGLQDVQPKSRPSGDMLPLSLTMPTTVTATSPRPRLDLESSNPTANSSAATTTVATSNGSSQIPSPRSSSSSPAQQPTDTASDVVDPQHELTRASTDEWPAIEPQPDDGVDDDRAAYHSRYHSSGDERDLEQEQEQEQEQAEIAELLGLPAQEPFEESLYYDAATMAALNPFSLVRCHRRRRRFSPSGTDTQRHCQSSSFSSKRAKTRRSQALPFRPRPLRVKHNVLLLFIISWPSLILLSYRPPSTDSASTSPLHFPCGTLCLRGNAPPSWFCCMRTAGAIYAS